MVDVKSDPPKGDLWRKLLLIAFPVILSGVGLWTWQNAYWQHQLEEKRKDWELRQLYERKEARSKAMVELITQMNKALETFITATLYSDSVRKRAHDSLTKDPSPENAARWKSMKDEGAALFNAAERDWLIRARVALGEIKIVFDDPHGEFSKEWKEIIGMTGQACSLFNETQATSSKIYYVMLTLRKQKDSLLSNMRAQFERFVKQQLEQSISDGSIGKIRER